MFDMKKITPREMNWINKGYIKNLSYNRFEAKAKDSYFLAVSDENFEFSNTISLNSKDFSIIVSISEKTFISVSIDENISIVSSNNGYITETFLDKKYIENNDSINISIHRDVDNFSFYIDKDLIAKTTLPAAKDAISFGYYFNNKDFIKITNFLYIKK